MFKDGERRPGSAAALVGEKTKRREVISVCSGRILYAQGVNVYISGLGCTLSQFLSVSSAASGDERVGTAVLLSNRQEHECFYRKHAGMT